VAAPASCAHSARKSAAAQLLRTARVVHALFAALRIAAPLAGEQAVVHRAREPHRHARRAPGRETRLPGQTALTIRADQVGLASSTAARVQIAQRSRFERGAVRRALTGAGARGIAGLRARRLARADTALGARADAERDGVAQPRGVLARARVETGLTRVAVGGTLEIARARRAEPAALGLLTALGIQAGLAGVVAAAAALERHLGLVRRQQLGIGEAAIIQAAGSGDQRQRQPAAHESQHWPCNSRGDAQKGHRRSQRRGAPCT